MADGPKKGVECFDCGRPLAEGEIRQCGTCHGLFCAECCHASHQGPWVCTKCRNRQVLGAFLGIDL
jgi:hypothetical protein